MRHTIDTSAPLCFDCNARHYPATDGRGHAVPCAVAGQTTAFGCRERAARWDEVERALCSLNLDSKYPDWTWSARGAQDAAHGLPPNPSCLPDLRDAYLAGYKAERARY